jgi:hypothetical protein
VPLRECNRPTFTVLPPPPPPDAAGLLGALPPPVGAVAQAFRNTLAPSAAELYSKNRRRFIELDMDFNFPHTKIIKANLIGGNSKLGQHYSISNVDFIPPPNCIR